MRCVRVVLLGLCCLLLFSSYLSAADVGEKRSAILKESRKTLEMLYKAYPESKAKIKKAYGYGTFSNFGINLIFFSAEGGSGLTHNNRSGKNTYMKMASGGLGFGLGVKDFRAIFIFENKKVFDSFVDSGWEANAQAEAAAKSGGKGGALEGAVTVRPGMKLYKLTKNGLALQATVQGTKYWKDAKLNK